MFSSLAFRYFLIDPFGCYSLPYLFFPFIPFDFVFFMKLFPLLFYACFHAHLPQRLRYLTPLLGVVFLLLFDSGGLVAWSWHFCGLSRLPVLDASLGQGACITFSPWDCVRTRGLGKIAFHPHRIHQPQALKARCSSPGAYALSGDPLVLLKCCRRRSLTSSASILVYHCHQL